MKATVAAFLSRSLDQWNEQNFKLLESPVEFAAREPAWFLKEFAREWKSNHKDLLTALKPERETLEARCVELAEALSSPVSDVRKHRFRPSYGDCPASLQVDGIFSRAKLRNTRTRTSRKSGLIKDLVTFSDSWTSLLARFTDAPLALAPIQTLGFPLSGQEIPDLERVLSKLPEFQSWPWSELYPARLLKLRRMRRDWPDDTPWPLLVWGEALERMLNLLVQMHSDVAMSRS